MILYFTFVLGWAQDVEAQDWDVTETFNFWGKTETLALPVETRRCYFSRCDRDVKLHVVLIAVVQLGLFVTFITSWRVSVINVGRNSIPYSPLHSNQCI